MPDRSSPRARGSARGARRAAHRGRRLRRAVSRPARAAASEGVRSQGSRDDLRVVFEMPRAGLSRRLGDRRPVREGARAREDHDDAVDSRSVPAGTERISLARRLRTTPAWAAPHARPPGRSRRAPRRALLSRRHAPRFTTWRLLSVGRVSRHGRHAEAAWRSSRARHQHCSGPTVLSHSPVRPLPATELRAPARRRASSPRCEPSARWPAR